ncbi:hypothetical protein [Lyngbya confervoides]|uniref:Phycobilisome protein n=1 Tax=Lyngbya confervoides BDU141951 TaxID=1574623 RepID=A0ABD4T5A8_9CYAN|nr:hypothetical protein [Lyngbya confervoides]MCM1983821.1 hypothetical protein [Lyngbya confervoides BDU141951]
MHTQLEQFLYQAEDRYLSSQEINQYSDCISNLERSLTAYKRLRDQEMHIFHIIADEVQNEHPHEDSIDLGESILQWMSLLRYCSMAMLMSNIDYLDQQLNGWFKEIVQMRKVQFLDRLIFETLNEVVLEVLSKDLVPAIQPYLQRLDESLFANSSQSLLSNRLYVQ